MPQLITLFTDKGTPELGLSATIRIRRLDTDALVVTDSAMTEVGDGLYRFNFDSGAGFDPELDYAFRMDGTVTLRDVDRYKFGGNEFQPEEIWDVTLSPNHVAAGTAGGVLDGLAGSGGIHGTILACCRLIVALILSQD